MSDPFCAESIEELKKIVLSNQQKITFLASELERVQETVKRDIADNWTMIESIRHEIKKELSR